MSMRLFCAAVLAASMSFAGAANARSVTFNVVNKTGSTLTAIYAGPSSQDEWGDNILDGGVSNGGTVSITIGDTSSCSYDLRYEFSGQETFEEYAIDVCSIDGEEYVIQPQ